MNDLFDNMTVDAIEEKLKADLKVHKKQTRIKVIIISLILMYIFRGSIAYWVKFSIPFVSGYTNEKIDVRYDPIQIDYTPEEQEAKKFKFHSLINDNEMWIIPQAHYILSGMVIAYNHDFIFISKFFDSASLYDLGTAWGNLADKKFFTKKPKIKVYSMKTEVTGSRILHYSVPYSFPMKIDYISTHISHTHIIPANRNVMAALLRLRKYQYFRIEGELVDMQYYDKKRGYTQNYRTSLSRNDNSDSGHRGYGSCETMYVTKVQIGNKIYE